MTQGFSSAGPLVTVVVSVWLEWGPSLGYIDLYGSLYVYGSYSVAVTAF